MSSSDIILTVAAASVRVSARILAPASPSAEGNVLQSLNTLTTTELTAQLGITAESVGTAAIATISVPYPSPPPTRPPPAPPDSPPSLPPPVLPPSSPPVPGAPPPLAPQLSAGVRSLLNALISTAVAMVGLVSAILYYRHAKRMDKLHAIKKEQCAIQLQAAARRQLARRYAEKRARVQAMWTTFFSRVQARGAAPMLIQACARGFLVRARRRRLMQELAAEHLQAHFLGRRTRRRMRDYRMRLTMQRLASRLEHRSKVAKRWRAFVEAHAYAVADREDMEPSSFTSAFGSVAGWLWRDDGHLVQRHLALCRVRIRFLQPPAVYVQASRTPTLRDFHHSGASMFLSGASSRPLESHEYVQGPSPVSPASPSAHQESPGKDASPQLSSRSRTRSQSFSRVPRQWRQSPASLPTSARLLETKADSTAAPTPHHGRLTDQLLASGAQSARGPARDITWANSGSSSSSRPLARSISFASHGGADPRTSSQTESPAVWLPWHRHTLPWPETQPRSATATQTPPQQVRGPPVLAWDDDQSDAWDPEHHQDVTA